MGSFFKAPLFGDVGIITLCPLPKAPNSLIILKIICSSDNDAIFVFISRISFDKSVLEIA